MYIRNEENDEAGNNNYAGNQNPYPFNCPLALNFAMTENIGNDMFRQYHRPHYNGYHYPPYFNPYYHQYYPPYYPPYYNYYNNPYNIAPWLLGGLILGSLY